MNFRLCLFRMLVACPIFFFGLKNTYAQDPFNQLVYPGSEIAIGIITVGDSIPDDIKIGGDIKLHSDPNGGLASILDFPDHSGNIKIEIRGSATLPKKGYSFQTLGTQILQDVVNAELLGLPEENDWIINGPYLDKSLMRNYLAYNLYRAVGRYASRTRFLELVLTENANFGGALDYKGVYVLLEKVKIDNNRVDINLLRPDENAFPSVTGGYILEIDELEDPFGGWTSTFPLNYGSNPVSYLYSDPKKSAISFEQRNYIQNYILEFETLMDGPNYDNTQTGYSTWIDVESFADFVIFQELSKNIDGYRSSTFFHKNKVTRDSLLNAGPVWDFNLAFGNSEQPFAIDYTGWQFDFNDAFPTNPLPIPFYWQKLMNTESFRNEVACRWNQHRQGPLSDAYIFALIDSTETRLQNPAERNFTRWPILDQQTPPSPVIATSNTYAEAVDQLRNWLENRLEWMDNELPGAGFNVQNTTPANSLIICPGDSITMSVTGGINDVYIWEPTTYLSGDLTSNTVSANPEENITYTVYGFNSFGCTDTAIIEVKINGFATTSAGPNVSVCPGESAQLEGFGGSVYSWSPGQFLNDSTIANPIATVDSTTSFTATILSNSGCIIEDKAKVIVFDPPEIEISPDQNICIGSSVLINSNGNGNVLWSASPIDPLLNPINPNPVVSPLTTTTYTASLTNSDGCSNSESVTITVADELIIDIPDTVTVCQGQPYTFNCQPNIVIASWVPSNGIIGSTTDPCPIIVLNSSQTYIVFLEDASGCSSTKSVFANVISAGSSINVGPNLDLCEGESVQLQTSGAQGNCAWFPTSGLNDTTVCNPIASPDETTTYTVTVQDANGCATSDQITLTVLPSEFTVSEDVLLCEGESAQLNAGGGVSYSWSPSIGLSCTNCPNPIANPSQNTTYDVFILNQEGCSFSESVNVSIAAPASFSIDPTLILCLDETGNLGVDGGTNSTYIWSPIDGLDNPTLANPEVNISETTTYEVTITDLNGCISTANQTVQINDGSDISVAENVIVCQDGSAVLNVTGGVSCVWTPAAGLDDANSCSPIVSPAVNTIYEVEITDANDCKFEQEVSIEIQANLFADAGENINACEGDLVTLSASGGSNFTWFPATGLSCVDCPNPTFIATNNIVYSVTVGDGNCFDQDSVEVFVNQNPSTTIFGNSTVCEGNEITLIASQAEEYIWTYNQTVLNTTIQELTFVPNVSGIVELTIINENGCAGQAQQNITVNPIPNVNAGGPYELCVGDSVQLQGSGSGSLFWFPNTNLCTTNGASTCAFPEITTQYTLTAVQNNCTNSATTTVTVNELPEITFTGNTGLCEGESTIINVNGAVNCTWSPNLYLSNFETCDPVITPENTITYTVEGIDNSGCINSENIEIEVSEIPITTVSASDTICYGESIQLSAAGGNSYLWTALAPVLSLDNDTIANPTASPLQTTTYLVEIFKDEGCSNSEFVTITVVLTSPANAGGDRTICQGESIQLQGFGGDNICSWSPSSFLDDPNSCNPISTPATSITYTLTTSSIEGCSSTDEVEITVIAKPSVFAGADKTICFGETLQLNAIGGDSYSWSPPNLVSNPFIPNPTTSITTNATLYLTVEQNGCFETDSIQLVVASPPQVSVPSFYQICPGGNSSLAVYGGENYFWSPATYLDDRFSQFPVCSPDTSITYQVEISDDSGCVVTEEVEVIVAQELAINIIEDQTICSGECVQLFVSGASEYIWGPNNSFANFDDNTIFNPTICPTRDITIEVVASDGICTSTESVDVTMVDTLLNVSITGDSIICFGGSTLLNATGLNDYNWSPATGLSCTDCPNPIANPTETTTYTLTSNSSNCSTEYEFTVEVDFGSINTTVSADTAVCAGSQIELVASGGIDYKWFPSNLFTGIINQSTTSLLVEDPVQVLVEITALNGCKNIDTINVDIKTAPDILANPAIDLCPNDTFKLFFDDWISYEIYPLQEVESFGTFAAFTPQNTTNFIIEATHINGCFKSQEIDIEILELPTIGLAADTTVCQGNTVQLDAQSNATSFSWSPTYGLSCTNCPNPQFTAGIPITYNLTATDNVGCAVSKDISIEIVPNSFVSTSGNVTICQGDSAQLMVTGGTNYSWSPNSGLSCSNCPNPISSPVSNTLYTVLVTNDVGCFQGITIDVQITNELSVNAGEDEEICASGNGVQLLASGGSNFSWSPSTGLSDSNIQNPIANPTTTTTYTVNSYGSVCSGSDQITIYVNENITQVPAQQITVCKGQPEILSTNVSDAETVIWSPTDFLNNATTKNPTATPDSSIIYSFEAYDSEGCLTEGNVVINVIESDATIDSSFISCSTNGVELQINGNGSATWFPNYFIDDVNALNPVVNPPNSLTYTANFTDTNGCAKILSTNVNVIENNDVFISDDVSLCLGESTQLIVIGGDAYNWSPSVGLDNASIGNPIASPTETTTYTVEITKGNCTYTDTINIEVINLANSGIVSPPTVCDSSIATLTAFGGNAYSWSGTGIVSNPNSEEIQILPTENSIYSVLVSAGNCFEEHQVTVEVGESETPFLAEEIFMCAGTNAQIQVFNSNLFENSISWEPPFLFSNPNALSPIITAIQDTTIKVTVFTNNGCQYELYSDVHVADDFSVNANSLAFKICEDDTVTICGSDASNFEWFKNDYEIISTAKCITVSPSSSTTYFLKGTDFSNTCSDTKEIIVDVSDINTVTINEDFEACEGDEIVLEASSGTNFKWSPQSLFNISNSQTVTTTISDNTLFTVEITDEIGCQKTDSVLVTVTTCFIENIPNTFTPNGDLINDFWVIDGIHRAENSSLQIVNRWGQVVLDVVNYNNNWDGTLKGNPLPEATYYYYLSINDDAEQFTGTITIIR